MNKIEKSVAETLYMYERFMEHPENFREEFDAWILNGCRICRAVNDNTCRGCPILPKEKDRLCYSLTRAVLRQFMFRLLDENKTPTEAALGNIKKLASQRHKGLVAILEENGYTYK